MIESLVSVVGQRGVDAAAFLLAFALTALTDSLFHNKLPHDHGREFAVNGGLSKGKARGSGLIFVLCIALVSLAFLPFRVEYVIYTVLLIASMLSGYFDDAAEKAWNEYKKGIIDFVIAVVAGVTYLNFNGCGVQFLQWSFTLPYAVYLLLIVILIWASINVVNCTDGVDGLSASLAVVTIGYGDGLPRDLPQRGGEVLLRGRRCPMVGRMCMDQLLVDVTELDAVSPGDVVTLIGRDGGQEIRAEETAERCGTITNELLSRLGSRISIK